LLFSNTFLALLLARIIIGTGVGITAVSVPSYISEIAPIAIRGRSIAIFQLFLTFGILAAYIIDEFFVPSGNWRAMFAVITIPALIFFITMYFLPESPRWLISKGKNEQAYLILRRFQKSEAIENEIQEINIVLNNEQSKWKDLLSSNLIFPLFLSIFIGVFNQLTAINGFLQYAPHVFNNAGFVSLISSMKCSIVLGIINCIGTIVGMVLVDKVGRCILLKLGTGGIVIAYFFLAIAYILHFNPFSSLIGLIFFVFCFAIGPGMVAWIIASELFPTHVRGKGMAIVLFSTSLFGWLVTTSFLQIEEKFTLGYTYVLFGTFTLIYYIVITKLLPETKQKSLEQIQIDMKKLS
jgi:MFS transporter, SP family, galactose:H+ symporter